MSDNFASLSPTLLARKGGAKPAMRSQMAAFAAPEPEPVPAPANLEDLGWNDMGQEGEEHDAEIVHLTPAPANEEMAAEAEALDREADRELGRGEQKPKVRQQIDEIAERLVNPSPGPQEAAAEEPKKPRRSALKQGKRAAFTLRLDAERHLKLRLASTVRDTSAQALVTEALDRLLKSIPEIDSLAAQVSRK